MSIYIAGPFFNREQSEAIDCLEDNLEGRELSHYSPRRSDVSKAFGALMKDPNATPEVKKVAAKDIFSENVEKLNKCQLIIAVVDNFDPGTIWELGYWYRLNKPTITTTFKDFGLNLMIGCCSNCHIRTEDTRDKVFNYLRDYISQEDVREFPGIYSNAEFIDNLERLSDPTGDMI